MAACRKTHVSDPAWLLQTLTVGEKCAVSGTLRYASREVGISPRLSASNSRLGQLEGRPGRTRPRSHEPGSHPGSRSKFDNVVPEISDGQLNIRVSDGTKFAKRQPGDSFSCPAPKCNLHLLTERGASTEILGFCRCYDREGRWSLGLLLRGYWDWSLAQFRGTSMAFSQNCPSRAAK